MKCLYCSSNQSSVIDKREVGSTGEIRRRRECLKCHRRYTTYERVKVEQLIVIKRDGRKEIFDSNKLRAGIERAFEKRPGADKVDVITHKVESKMRAKGKGEIESKSIGMAVLSEIKRIDKVAYLRFASVYRQFNDLVDFSKELENLKITVSKI